MFKTFTLSCGVILAASTLSAQVRGEPVVISASRVADQAFSTGLSVTVIGPEEIDPVRNQKVHELLSRQYGIDVAASSRFGGVTGLFIRGMDSDKYTIMIDGIRVNDPTMPSGGFDLAHLSLFNVERIEIVRGSQSVVNGTDALGGVINIITRRAHGDFANLMASAGTERNYTAGASMATRTEKGGLAISANAEYADGPSKARDTDERDSYRSAAFSAGGDYALSTAVRFLTHSSYTWSRTEIDDGAYTDDPNHYNTSGVFTTRNALEWSPFERMSLTAAAGLFTIDKSDRDDNDAVDTTENDSYAYRGVRTSGEASIRIAPVELLTIAAGMDVSRDEYTFTQLSAWGNTALDESSHQYSAYVQSALNFSDIAVINGGARWTDSSIGGDALCWQASTSLRAKATGTSLRASIGTGFKVPTLYQAYDPQYGNRDLKPEKSRYWDAAVTQKILGEILALELGWFDITVKDSIAWFMTDPMTWAGEYRNIGEAHSRGIEATMVLKPTDTLQISGNYTWQRAIDEDTSKELLKRPEHKANASIAWHADAWSAGMSAQYTGERTDYGDVTLNDYVLLGARASYRFAAGYTVFASADNLLNASYQNTAGYDTPGINGAIGVKGEF